MVAMGCLGLCGLFDRMRHIPSTRPEFAGGNMRHIGRREIYQVCFKADLRGKLNHLALGDVLLNTCLGRQLMSKAIGIYRHVGS